MTRLPLTFRTWAALQKSDAAAQAPELVKLLHDNNRFAADLVTKALQRLLLLALLFTLLANAQLSELSVFGLKFKSVEVPLALLLVACGFLFYRLLSLFAIAQTIEAVLREYYGKQFPEWSTSGISHLIIYPSINGIETVLTKIERSQTWLSHISDWWAIGAPMVLALVSLGWFGWSMFVVVERLPITLAVIAVALTAIFVARGVLVVFHFIGST